MEFRYLAKQCEMDQIIKLLSQTSLKFNNLKSKSQGIFESEYFEFAGI